MNTTIAPKQVVTTFHCDDCQQTITHTDQHTTGYAKYEGLTVCFACCGKRDRQQMIDSGKITLYLCHNGGGLSSKLKTYYVANYPGNLSFPCTVNKGKHNIAGSRYDVYFTGPDGFIWHGVNYGESSQLCRCKRTKRKA